MFDREKILKLYQTLDYHFRNPKLLIEALTHPSWMVNKDKSSTLQNYQRLEFVGDAVIELLTSEVLFNEYYEAPEGELTKFRSMMVNNERLAQVARQFKLGEYILFAPGAEELRDDSRILACAFEAVIGAVFIDSAGGYLAVKKIIGPRFFADHQLVIGATKVFDPKSCIQEKAQEKFGITPTYKVLNEWGSDHARSFEVGVFLKQEMVGKGEGKSIKEAQKNAASNALKETRDLANVPFSLLKRRDVLSDLFPNL